MRVSRRRISCETFPTSSSRPTTSPAGSADRGRSTASSSTTRGISSTCATRGRSSSWTSCGRTRLRSSRATRRSGRGASPCRSRSRRTSTGCRRDGRRRLHLGAAEALSSRCRTTRRSLPRLVARGVGTRHQRGVHVPVQREALPARPREMTADWVSWAVPRPNLAEIVRGALGIANERMGYNASFRYPRKGGIEVVPNAFAARLKTLRIGARVTGVDLDAKTVTLGNGEEIAYERLVSTIPLPVFSGWSAAAGFDGAALASRLDWSVVGCLNLGIARPDVGTGRPLDLLPRRGLAVLPRGVPARDERRCLPARSLVALRRVRAEARRARGPGRSREERRRGAGRRNLAGRRSRDRARLDPHRSRLRRSSTARVKRSSRQRSLAWRLWAFRRSGVTVPGPTRTWSARSSTGSKPPKRLARAA